MVSSSLHPPRLLTLLEVAERLAVSTKTLRRWIALNELRSHRLGRQIRVAEEDLHAFLARRRA
jgi:excisionase family DNA binding protein